MNTPSLLGMEWTSWWHIATSIFFHSSRITSFRAWMLDGEWCSTCRFRIPHRCSIGFRRPTSPFNHLHPVFLQKCNSSFRCVFWIIVMLEKCVTTKFTEWWQHLIEQYIVEFMIPSMKCSYKLLVPKNSDLCFITPVYRVPVVFIFFSMSPSKF